LRGLEECPGGSRIGDAGWAANGGCLGGEKVKVGGQYWEMMVEVVEEVVVEEVRVRLGVGRESVREEATSQAPCLGKSPDWLLLIGARSARLFIRPWPKRFNSTSSCNSNAATLIIQYMCWAEITLVTITRAPGLLSSRTGDIHSRWLALR
jgi:hypothetical protein